MRMLQPAAAGLALIVGVAVITWAGYAYWEAAHGGAGDLTSTGWAIYATVGAFVGTGFVYLAWRCYRRVHGVPPRDHYARRP